MRVLVALLFGLLVALGLFLFSSALISDEHLQKARADDPVRLEFIRTVPEEREFLKERELPRKQPPPNAPPPVNRIESVPAAQVAALPVRIEIPDIAVPVVTGFGPYLGTYTPPEPGTPTVDGDLIPLVQVSPRYPRHAQFNGIEGWVNVEFTIAPDGTVSDPIVIAAEPPQIFNRSAVNAIVRWKFKPRVVDGEPVASRGQQLISFDLIERS